MPQERWQRLTYWPLNVASLVFLLAYTWRVIGNLNGPAAALCNVAMAVVWALFAVHFFVGLVIARPRGAWFRKNWWQLIFVVVPALQPVRLLRLVPVLVGARQGQGQGSVLRSRIATYVGLTLVLVLYVGAVMVLDSEQNAPGANIVSFGDSVWWAIVTITTVGYGDFVPVTVQGRVVAAGLMVSGVALIGTVTGLLASYVTERARADDPSRSAATKAQVDELTRGVERLTESLGAAAQTSADEPSRPTALPAAER